MKNCGFYFQFSQIIVEDVSTICVITVNLDFSPLDGFSQDPLNPNKRTYILESYILSRRHGHDLSTALNPYFGGMGISDPPEPLPLTQEEYYRGNLFLLPGSDMVTDGEINYLIYVH